MVASPAHGEGASTIVSRLALALAGLGHPRVLVVDANFRRPRLHEVFHVEETGGLAELIAGEVALDAVTRDIGTPNLRLVTAGRQLEGTAQLLAAPRLGEVLGELGRAHDITILDAPPVLPYADALALASLVDRVVLVTQAGHTGRGHLERATAELVRSGATILGVVLNRTSSHAPPWLDRRFSA
jgi:capsular exopolysaccharide synthesis family protein